MFRRLTLIIAMLPLLLCGCENTDMDLATQAGLEAVQAVTLSDEAVRRLARQLAQQSDERHPLAPADSPHAQRLARLTAAHGQRGGQRYDFKVYLAPTVNAFAMADGTIRIYSGLMEMLTDDELLFVIGHEMGHVAARHIQKKIRLAYAGSAVRKAVASQQGEAGDIARSALGVLAERLLSAQFSQQEEREADDYGLAVVLQAGHSRQAAVNALLKLASLGGQHSFLSSHPAPAARARRLQEDHPQPGNRWMELPTRTHQWLKDHLPRKWPFLNHAPEAP